MPGSQANKLVSSKLSTIMQREVNWLPQHILTLVLVTVASSSRVCMTVDNYML